MSLDTILEAIHDAGRQQVLRIEMATQKQVNDILDQARREADHIQEQACSDATAPAFRERSRILHEARLSALRIIGEARQTFVETVLERTRDQLAYISSEPIYPIVLHRLTQLAFDELEGSLGDIHNAMVEIDPRDLELMERILADMDLNLPMVTELNVWGGLIVKSEGAKVVVINTLEARLNSATSYLRRFLAALFENQEWLVSTTATPV